MSEVKASFDVQSLEGKMRVFNAQNGASISMKELDNGQVIECSGAMQYRDTVDSYGQEQESDISVLFAEDGTSYASISETVAKAVDKLVDFVHSSDVETFKVKIIKQTSGKGNEFINLQLVG